VSNARIAALLAAHRPADAKEAADMRVIARLLGEAPELMRRAHAPGHVTGSALVVDAQSGRFLLHRHRTLRRWLQFGGHADPDEHDPAQTARREAAEETGLDDLRFLVDRPVDIDVHEIPARGGVAAHLHLDFRYVLLTDGARTGRVEAGESSEFAWLTRPELAPGAVDPPLARLIDKALALFTAAGGGSAAS
jgi:8-oxo-dGTP pyrophosphatase MutT (NUDIX family)